MQKGVISTDKRLLVSGMGEKFAWCTFMVFKCIQPKAGIYTVGLLVKNTNKGGADYLKQFIKHQNTPRIKIGFKQQK